MVDHLLQVTVDAVGERGEGLAGALAAQGFQVRVAEGRVVASSAAIEPQVAKARLRSLGFADREFRVYLEYFRRWGFM